MCASQISVSSHIFAVQASERYGEASALLGVVGRPWRCACATTISGSLHHRGAVCFTTRHSLLNVAVAAARLVLVLGTTPFVLQPRAQWGYPTCM